MSAIRPCCFLLTALLTSFAATAQAADTDSDAIADDTDNCVTVKNAGQIDSDSDGYGNACDPDFNNDGRVNALDLSLFRQRSLNGDLSADMNADGRVNALDLAIFRQFSAAGLPPGPSGQVNTITDAGAARFLDQATFGTKTQDIQGLKAKGSYAAWIDSQFALPANLLLPGTKQLYDNAYNYCQALPAPEDWCPGRSLTEVLTAGADGEFDINYDLHRHVWWKNAVDGNDQLRQRVALALSEILVVSDIPDALSNSTFGVASYYDALTRNAFGNYRQLLDEVTLHPVMGMYLNMQGNEKADPARNIRPDENYAREILQLFSIGVHKLHQDGTPMLDGAGKPIPTYGQAEVREFARVFTGWSFADMEYWGQWYDHADRTRPMVSNGPYYTNYHDYGTKRLLDGYAVPAGLTPRQDLTAALDNIFNHPNVGPFIGKQLIQRLTTSNPSPGYVSRVAAVFNNNGAGVRGDMKAVVKAILLDPEARAGVARQPHFGKLREPLLRMTHMFRAFGGKPVLNAYGSWGVSPNDAVYASPGSYFGLQGFEGDVGQNILRSPSVFNFFFPDHSPVGAIRSAGLVAPEFQIATANNIMGMSNTIQFHVLDADREQPTPHWTYLDLAREAGLAANPDALLDHLDVLLTGGSMTASLRQIVKDHLNDPVFPSDAEGRMDRARDAVALILHSPEYLIQK